MTHKLWLKKLKLKYSKDVFDIVQFGSSVMETMENAGVNDTDIAVVFYKILLKDQLNQAQKIKKQIQKISEMPVHIKSFDLYSFFDASNFAKENILFYGKSLIYRDFFSKRFGLTPKIQLHYSLTSLKKREKIKFNYMLNGKKGKYGLLRKYKGRLLAPGIIEINPDCEDIFISSIKKLTSKFEIRKVLF